MGILHSACRIWNYPLNDTDIEALEEEMLREWEAAIKSKKSRT